MAQVTTIFGLALSLFGARQYIGSPNKHITALFPTLVGALMAAFGLLGAKPSRTKLATGLSLGAAVAGMLIAAQGLLFPQLFKSTADGANHPQRRATQFGMAVLCGIYAIFAIASMFQPARKR